MKSWALTVLILQIAAVFFMIVALVVGDLGNPQGLWDPSPAILPLEIVFIVITSLLLLASIVMILVELIMDLMGKPISKKLSAGYCILAGILMVISAMLLITIAALIKSGKKEMFDVLGVSAKLSQTYFAYNIAGGVMAIIGAVLYFVAGFLTCKHYGTGQELCT